MTGFVDFKKGDFILVRHNTTTPWRLAIFHGWTCGHSMVEVYLFGFTGGLHRYRLWQPLPASAEPNGGEWMVSVAGGAAPRKVHSTFESACTEAKRLIEELDADRTCVLRLERTYICKRIAVEEETEK